MTTIAEDLYTLINTDFNDGTVTETTHVFMKTQPDTTQLVPPAEPAANKCTIVIYEGTGVPLRRTQGADLIVYTGRIIVFAPTYATMILSIAELKQISEDMTSGTGDLILTVPPIHGEIRRGYFVCEIDYRWEKLTDRG